MRILITGGTGLIGRHLCAVLLAQGHALTVLSRHPETVTAKCGAGVQAMKSLDEWTSDRVFDAVINLAGEPIVDAYWSAKRKQVLLDSRVGLTEKLVQRITAAQQKPAVLLSGSAVGYTVMAAIRCCMRLWRQAMIFHPSFVLHGRTRHVRQNKVVCASVCYAPAWY